MKYNYKKIINIIVLVIVCTLSVGYAAFGNELSISNIIADIRVSKDVRITNVTLISENSNGIYPLYLNYDAETVVTKVTFNDMSSYATYKVTISNFGNQEIGILNVNTPEGIGYEISNYNLKEKICDENNLCSLGINKDIIIKIYPTTETGLNLENIEVDFDFQPYNKVTYTNITFDSTYPTEVINGGSLTIQFKEDIKRVLITSPSKQLAYYRNVTTGQKITIDNITTDVEIKKAEQVAQIASGDLETPGSEICIGTECFYLMENKGNTVSLISKYNLYVGGEYNGSSYKLYDDTATGIQKSDMIGWINGVTTRRGVIKYDDNAYWSQTVNAYPSYVYNSNSYLYSYLEYYKHYLTIQDAIIDDIRLPNQDELEKLGCSISTGKCTNSDYKFIYSTSYWTGIAESTSSAYRILTDGRYGANPITGWCGLRPVIELNIAEIKPFIGVKDGDVDTVGSEICLDKECFHVISSTTDTVTMLSKYNLHVGKSINSEWVSTDLENPTGIQDATALGYNFTASGLVFPFIGTTTFYGSTYKGENNSDYNGSLLEHYVNNYDNYIRTEIGIETLDARLITLAELEKLGCSTENSNCNDAPSFVYSTSYRSMTPSDTNSLWSVYTSKKFITYTAGGVTDFGVRPVITISKSDLQRT